MTAAGTRAMKEAGRTQDGLVDLTIDNLRTESRYEPVRLVSGPATILRVRRTGDDSRDCTILRLVETNMPRSRLALGVWS